VDALNYRVILEPESDGTAYNVIVPAFPHVHTFGADVAEAMQNAREAIELELECAREHGDAVPPSDAEHVVIGTVTINPAA
jgi:predicted RNase H-like HicB family nuclease